MLLTLFPNQTATAAGEFTVTATAAPAKVAPGETVAVTASLLANVTEKVIVDVEVYDTATWKKVHQKLWYDQSLTAGQSYTYPTGWTVPDTATAGKYVVSVGLFKAGWAGQISWHAGVAAFEVGTGPSVPTFTGSASVTPATVNAGETVAIVGSLTSSLQTTARVEAQVLGPSGATVFAQTLENQAFQAGQATQVPFSWAVPASAESGTYTVKLGVFSPDGAQTWYQNESAAQVTVNGLTLSFDVTGAVSPNPAQANGQVSISTYITASAATKILVDVEVYGPTGARVLQQFYDNIEVQGGVAKEVQVPWSLPLTAANGTYTVSVGIFKAGWAGMHDWKVAVTTFDVTGGVIPAITSAVTVGQSPVSVGATAGLTATVTSNTTLPATIVVDLYSPLGARVAQETFSNQTLTAGETASYNLAWTVPADALNGEYRSVVTVLSTDGGQTYHKNQAAGAFTVTGGLDLTFASTASASPSPVAMYKSVTISASVSSSVATNVTAVLSAVGQSGAELTQKRFENLALAAGVAQSLSFDWKVPAGTADQTASVNVQLLSADGAVVLHSNVGAAQFEILTPPDAPAPRPTTPPALPKHFGVGVTADPDADGLLGWMPETGLPWDYAYHYLNGGVNNTEGWRYWGGWNDGMWAYNYAKMADAKGYMPVFTYYQILQSDGDCNSCPEDKRDLANLNNVETMKAYWAELKQLMQLMGTGNYRDIQGFGKTMIIHVEPDMHAYAHQAVQRSERCYGFCTGEGNDPSLLKAAVSNTGMPELEGLPNTWQGFNWAVLRLRDLYAPNVLLAIHPSSWGTLYDVGANTDPTLDVVGLGKLTGEFIAKSGAVVVPEGSSTYDLVFADVLDRDAAYYKIKYGSKTSWWDKLNVKLPHFNQWLTWYGEVLKTTGKQGMIWQIPLGNQYFATMNNTTGHYQDNRAEYFWDHIPQLIDLDIVGLMFGWGERQQTSHWDARRGSPYVSDGITNGTPFCTTDGLSSGEVCNTHISTVADDDGGYLRMRATEYYKSPVILP